MQSHHSDKQLEALVGVKVKIHPNRGKKKGGPTVATLKGLDGSFAIVVPSGHRREERIPKECVAVWKKGLSLCNREDLLPMFETVEETVTENGLEVSSWVIVSKTLNLFWINRQRGFSYDLSDAGLYTNTTGAKVACNLIGKPKKNKDGVHSTVAWAHIRELTEFEVVSYEEAETLEKQWKKFDSGSAVSAEEMSNPYYGESLFKRESLETAKEKTVEEESGCTVVSLNPNAVETEEKKKEQQVRALDAYQQAEADQSSKETVPTRISFQKKITDLINKKNAARQQVLDARQLLLEAEAEVEQADMELQKALVLRQALKCN